MHEVTRIKDILKKYSKGEEIPGDYNERIIKIIITLLPELESRIYLFDDFIRKNRIFGKSTICDSEGTMKISLESRSGVILKAYVQTVIYDKEKKMAGVVDRSILNDSIKLKNAHKEINFQPLKEDS